MWYRHLPPLFLGLLAGLFDATVASWLSGWFVGIRAALPFVILLATFSRPRRAILAAIAAGVAIDVLQPVTGLVTFRLLFVIAAITLVARLYVTNRSLVGSLTLGAIGFVADRVALWVVEAGIAFLNTEAFVEYRPPALLELLWIATCIFLAFWVFAAFTRRFMPLVSHR